MPEISVIHVAVIAAAVLVGVVLGWIVRGHRTAGEKAAINAGWQEQIEAQRGEHERLLQQNRSLMEQNSQYQASNKDARNRATELSGALKEAFERRDELQRQIKEIRGNLERAISERDQLQVKVRKSDGSADVLRRRDEQIDRLQKELASWRDRLPPLIERYRQRNEEAERLERELEAARERIAGFESSENAEETRVEPADREKLGNALDASNEPLGEDDGEELVAAEALIEDDDPDNPAETEAATDEEDDPDEDDWTAAIEMDAADDDHGREPIRRDDLKLIKGVGPAIEKTLNEMGIFRFNQIAEMSEYDIDRIARRLKGFRTRIYREDWIGQARDLQLRKVSG